MSRSAALACLFAAACGPPRPGVESTFSLTATAAPSAVERFGLSSPAEQLLGDEDGAFVVTAARFVHLGLDGSEREVPVYAPDRRVPGKVQALAPRHGSGPLVLAEGGLFYFDRGVLVASPATAGLPASVTRVAHTDTAQLWFGAGDGLYVLRGGALSRLEIEADPIREPVTQVQYALGRVYAISGNRVTAVQLSDLSVRRSADLKAEVKFALHTRGVIWAATSERLYRLTWGEQTLEAVRVADVSPPRLWAGAADSAWFLFEDQLWRVRGDEATSTVPEGVALGAVTALAGDEAGSVWLAAGPQLHNVTLGRVLRVAGVREGGSVLARLFVRSWPSSPALVQQVVTTVGGTSEVATRPPFELGGKNAAGEVQGFDVSPLPAGVSTLEVSARWSTGESVTRSFRFEVVRVLPGSPTYATHIEPIYRTRCSKCHIAGAAAFDLDGADKWRAKIDAIMTSVSERKMPADGPLAPELIDVIQRWKQEGTPP